MQKLYWSFQKLLVIIFINFYYFIIANSLIICINILHFLLAVNSGFDAQDIIVKLLEESSALGEAVGLDLSTGEALKPVEAGIYDNYNVKKQIINSW